MTVRSLDFLDLPFLSRSRRNVLPLYSARILTRGNPLGARAMLSYLNPRRQIYTRGCQRRRRFADGTGHIESGRDLRQADLPGAHGEHRPIKPRTARSPDGASRGVGRVPPAGRGGRKFPVLPDFAEAGFCHVRLAAHLEITETGTAR